MTVFLLLVKNWHIGTPIFSFIRRLRPSCFFVFFFFFGGGSTFEFQYFGGFQKNEYVLGYEDFFG